MIGRPRRILDIRSYWQLLGSLCSFLQQGKSAVSCWHSDTSLFLPSNIIQRRVRPVWVWDFVTGSPILIWNWDLAVRHSKATNQKHQGLVKEKVLFSKAGSLRRWRILLANIILTVGQGIFVRWEKKRTNELKSVGW